MRITGDGCERNSLALMTTTATRKTLALTTDRQRRQHPTHSVHRAGEHGAADETHRTVSHRSKSPPASVPARPAAQHFRFLSRYYSAPTSRRRAAHPMTVHLDSSSSRSSVGRQADCVCAKLTSRNNFDELLPAESARRDRYGSDGLLSNSWLDPNGVSFLPALTHRDDSLRIYCRHGYLDRYRNRL